MEAWDKRQLDDVLQFYRQSYEEEWNEGKGKDVGFFLRKEKLSVGAKKLGKEKERKQRQIDRQL